MKPSNKNIENEIEKILQSASNQSRVSTSPFFTTRVIGKVEQAGSVMSWIPTMQMMLRPVLILILVLNVLNFYVYTNTSNSHSTTGATIDMAMSEYADWNEDFVLSDELIVVN